MTFHRIFHRITTNLCACHDSVAGMTCAKFCSNHSLKIWMRAKQNFHWIWIAMENNKEMGPWHVSDSWQLRSFHDDVIKWKHFPRYWPFVRGIHRSPVNSPHKDQWRRALMFFFICVWRNLWVNNHKAGDLRCQRAHYDVIVMIMHEKLFGKKQFMTVIYWG